MSFRIDNGPGTQRRILSAFLAFAGVAAAAGICPPPSWLQTGDSANAGKFGAGFAVVADEVKNLAKTTAEFTAEIDSRVTDMTNQVENVTGAMAGVSSIIKRIHGMQDTIAAAVKQQTGATARITASIDETAAGCRGDSSRRGIHAMPVQLAGLAEELQSLSGTL